MEIILTLEAAQQIRSVLGDDIDLSPGAVPSALSRLAVEAPAVYSQILANLSGTQIRLDSERALARARWWRSVRARLFWWGEYESDAGDRLIAKRHVAAAVPLGLAGVILLLLVGSSVFRHHPSVQAARRPAAMLSASHLALLQPTVVERARSPLVARLSALTPLTDLPSPPPGVQAWASAPGASATQPAPPAESPRNPLVFNRDSNPGASVAALVPAGAGAQDGPGSPVVYDRDGSGSASESQPAVSAEANSGRATDAAGEAGPEARWAIGRRVDARLATGVLAVSGGTPLPAIAETDRPAAVWLGQATLAADGRVQIAFTLTDRRDVVRGIALDPGRLVPGLAGRTELRQPQAAAAAVTAAAAAAAAYARALTQQGLALSGSWGELTLGQPAPPWAYLASSLADGVAPRTSVSGPVETTEIPARTPLIILITEAP